MWFSFWRSRDRLSLDELRFLVDQLMKLEVVNEVNKEFLIEALRSIAELITWGDQHDAAYFEFFMEKQVIGEFVRILRTCKSQIVSRQLLQTMSIMIQNLKNEHSIYYMFSNEHVNYLITYPFDFRNEELLSYYISFVRAISGKLNKDTISLLVKTENDEVVDFPLYVEAIRFAFHEESMIRTAVRSLTLNVYHVGDEAVNRFISGAPHADYFFNLVKFFQDQCIHLDKVVSNAKRSLSSESASSILSAVDEIEDNLYYFSDVVSAGIPDVGLLIMDNVLRLLIFPLILPSFRPEAVNEPGLGAVTSLYLLCCILRIVKIKDLANTVAAALLCYPEIFPVSSEAKLNGNVLGHASLDVPVQNRDANNHSDDDAGSLQVTTPATISSKNNQLHNCGNMKSAPSSGRGNQNNYLKRDGRRREIRAPRKVAEVGRPGNSPSAALRTCYKERSSGRRASSLPDLKDAGAQSSEQSSQGVRVEREVIRTDTEADRNARRKTLLSLPNNSKDAMLLRLT